MIGSKVTVTLLEGEGYWLSCIGSAPAACTAGLFNYCHYCHNCHYCHYCLNCHNCHYCCYCPYCHYCYYCYYCYYCDYCDYCDYCLLSTVYCLLSTVFSLQSTVYCLLSTVYCQDSRRLSRQLQTVKTDADCQDNCRQLQTIADMSVLVCSVS